MAALAGRGLRIKISGDGGTTYTAIVGSTADNFRVTKAGIPITDKDDAGVETYLNDAVGKWAMNGGFSGILKDATILTLMADVDQFTYDMQVDIAGIGTWEGLFGITEFGPDGNEGEEAVTYTGTIVSSGIIAFTAA